jgi:hypothetical protein
VCVHSVQSAVTTIGLAVHHDGLCAVLIHELIPPHVTYAVLSVNSPHLHSNTEENVKVISLNGDEGYVLAKNHKMCKLANWSRPSNITFCSRAPGRVIQKSKPNNRTYICGECQEPNYSIGVPGRKRLISA